MVIWDLSNKTLREELIGTYRSGPAPLDPLLASRTASPHAARSPRTASPPRFPSSPRSRRTNRRRRRQLQQPPPWPTRKTRSPSSLNSPRLRRHPKAHPPVEISGGEWVSWISTTTRTSSRSWARTSNFSLTSRPVMAFLRLDLVVGGPCPRAEEAAAGLSTSEAEAALTCVRSSPRAQLLLRDAS